ncbi:MAG: Ig-like domain-containing protein [Anaeromyxobacteraceae bacterium]
MRTPAGLLLAALALACGASRDAGPVKVVVAPEAVALATGQSTTFSATVTGTSDHAVIWSVDGGAIDATGRYTAPGTPGSFTVTATSTADASRSGRALVLVNAGGACLASGLLASLGKSDLLVGLSGADASAAAAAWDLRYVYLAGVVKDPAGACTGPGYSAWWGCWQDLSQPPGQYVTGFVSAAAARGQVPMFTYYVLLPASGAPEGAGEVAAAKDVSFMATYLRDWRFLLQRVGTSKALLHVEPDLWGYAEQANADPHQVPAAVATANPTDCAGQENSFAGLGRCMIAMVRTYAPNAMVGLHASAWGTKIDVLGNTNASFDVEAEGRKLGVWLAAAGADVSDFVVADQSDRDAGYYASLGRDTWWDATNATLPNFHQALAWANAVAGAVGRPILWWQVPVGNLNQANTTSHWQDNRVQYFFDHPAEYAASGAVGIAFGAGADGQTVPETDGGYLVSRAKAYLDAGGTPACP